MARRAAHGIPGACQFFYDCEGCSARLNPRLGDCCVYCSYADMPCPPVQAGACSQ